MNKNLYIGKRILNALSQKFSSRLGVKIKPSMIANFAITSKCNLYCKTCNIGLKYTQSPESADDDLTLKEIEDFFSTNQNFLKQVNWIQITGGEPFLREDLVKIVEIIRKYLLDCNIWIATNGLNTDYILSQIRELLSVKNELGVGVSLHGLEKSHDDFTGIPGSYHKAITTVTGLKKLREDFPSLRISLSFTLFGENYNELMPVFNLSKKLGIEFTLRPTNYSDIYYKNNKTDLRFSGDRTKLESAIQNFIKQTSFNKSCINPRLISRLYYYTGILEFIRRPRHRRLPCLAGLSSFFLDAKGNIYPCLMVDRKLGNIRKDGLNQIWDSKNAQQIQQEIKKGTCPNCWVECETYRSIYENVCLLAFFWIKRLFKLWFSSQK